MSTAHVQPIMYDQIPQPKLVLRSGSYREPYHSPSGNRHQIYIRRYCTDPELFVPDVPLDHYGHHNAYSNLKGRLVVRARCESDTEYDYRSECNTFSEQQVHADGFSASSSSSSTVNQADINVLEVSPSRSGFVLRSPMPSPGHHAHATEQQGYFPAAQSQHSPYSTVRSGRYAVSQEPEDHREPWSTSHTHDRQDEPPLIEEGDLNPNYWGEQASYPDPRYEDYQFSPAPQIPQQAAPPRRANTTPTGTIRVNGTIVNAACPKRRSPVPFKAEEPTPQSAFFGFNPTPHSQRGPSSTGTGTVLRRGLHRHQHRRHSEGSMDDFHQLGPTQDECTQCNGEGCVRSLAIKEYSRQMENGHSNPPDMWGPGVRQLVGERAGWNE